jgi:hypothetical protein
MLNGRTNGVTDSLALLRLRGRDRALAELDERLFGLEHTLQAIRRFARVGDIGRVMALVDVALGRESELRRQAEPYRPERQEGINDVA